MTRLTEIRERVEKASPGPWEVIGPWPEINIGHHLDCATQCDPQSNYHDFDPIAHLGETKESSVTSDANAQFISHARSDIPWLLEQLEAARKEIERLKKP